MMATKFRLQWVLFWLVLILTSMLIAYFFTTLNANKTEAIELPEHWIGPPKFGMDAGDANLRGALLSVAQDAEEESIDRPLVKACGIYVTDPSEIYTLTRPVIVWGDASRAGSRITFEVLGEQVKVTKWTLPIPLPPPPSMGGDTTNVVTKNNQADAVIKRQFFIATKSSLDALAKQWKTSLVWNSKQSEVDCLDGFGVRLEACINNQYAIRDGVCAENGMELADAADAALAMSGFK
jgi:hypothetical protein